MSGAGQKKRGREKKAKGRKEDECNFFY